MTYTPSTQSEASCLETPSKAGSPGSLSPNSLENLAVSVFGSEAPSTPPYMPMSTNDGDTDAAQVHIGTDILTVHLPKTVLLAMSVRRGADHGPHSLPYTMEEVNAASLLVQELTKSAGTPAATETVRAYNSETHHGINILPAAALNDDTELIPRYSNGLLGDAPTPQYHGGMSSRSLRPPMVIGGRKQVPSGRRASSGFEFERKSTGGSMGGSGSWSDIVRMARESKGSARLHELLENSTPLERSTLIREELAANVVVLSTHTHGCRVVQKAIEVGTVEDCRFLSAGIGPRVLELCGDVNGNHVMQKFIERLPSEEVQFIVDALSGKDDETSESSQTASHVLRLSVHCYGCRVLQRLLQKCEMPQKIPVLDAVVYGTVNVAERYTLVNDQFGNYVIQHSLQLGRVEDRKIIVRDFLLPFVGELCTNKFGSNVVEKALEFCDMEDKRALVRVLLTPLSPGAPASCPIVGMMKDRYANYVVGRILVHDEKDMPEVRVVRRLVEDNIEVLKKFTYGWHMIEKLQRAGKISAALVGKPPSHSLQLPTGGGRRRGSSHYSVPHGDHHHRVASPQSAWTAA